MHHVVHRTMQWMTPQDVLELRHVMSHPNTCSNDAVDGYWTTDVVDNIENYLEYSYCSKMFTPGQKSRMRAALVSSVAVGIIYGLLQIIQPST